MRRAGMNVLYFNYRGSWGSGGDFSFANAQEDVATAVRWLRSPEIATKYRVDPRRIALIGHSMGGWLALLGAAQDTSIACVGGLEFADMARRMTATRADSAALATRMTYDDWLTEPGAPLHADARSLERSLEENATRWDLTTHANELAAHTVLLLDDDKNADHAVLVSALGKAGAKHLTTHIWPTDHTFSDRRIILARTVLRWLRDRCGY
jgi:alpha/beta superfamily hydrolase